jgi:hypothetical protein
MHWTSNQGSVTPTREDCDRASQKAPPVGLYVHTAHRVAKEAPSQEESRDLA